MRWIFCALVLMLLLAACRHHVQEKVVLAPHEKSLTIKVPALVVFKNSDTGNLDHVKFLSQQFGLAFYNTGNEMITYPDSAGKMNEMKFNMLSPGCSFLIIDKHGKIFPGVISNADKVFDSAFAKKKLINRRLKQKHLARQVSETEISQPEEEIIRSDLEVCNPRPRKLVLAIPDTATQFRLPELRAPVQFIFQSVSTARSIKIIFENDLLTYNNTDRYFTNGIGFELRSARLANSRLNALMLPYRQSAALEYSLSLNQDIYTPKDTRVEPSLSNDRPYASVLYVGYLRCVTDRYRRLKLLTRIDLGFIGPYSQGANLQKAIHRIFPTNDKPLGWETQIKTDVVINYDLQFEKPLTESRHLLLTAQASARAGTLISSAGAGLTMLTGWFDPVYNFSNDKPKGKVRCYLSAEANGSGVAYNALLQGGMFNRKSIFLLNADEISRFVGSASAGMVFEYKGYGLTLMQHYLSPEYKTGLWHKWGAIAVKFRF